MAEEIEVSTSTLSGADLHALITYLRTIPALQTRGLPASKTAPAADSPEPVRAGLDARGKEIFAGACVSCHSWSGVSLLTNYATLTGDRSVNDPTAINVAQIILSGELRHTAEGVVLMPSFADAYSDTEIAAVANYVTARFGAQSSHLTAEDVAGFRKETSH